VHEVLQLVQKPMVANQMVAVAVVTKVLELMRHFQVVLQNIPTYQ
jgi:hypothetical protein